MMNKTRTGLVALAIALPLSLAACGSDSTTSSTPAAGGAMSSSSPMMSSSEPTPSDSMSSSSMGSESMDASTAVFGEGCAQVPASGSGSFSGMATDPVATAASNNPLLKTLVSAVKTAGLVDTLNSAKDITVFAPVDSAFAKIPSADLQKVLDDKATLTKVLTNHVVAGKLTPADLAGTHKTLAGTEITVAGSGEKFTVGKDKANVICGNVQTANATVYIIDGVLLP
ncbi:fasciclin domain-containing protein [Terracoccus luteus]|jgi:uncharacterized surface protein with fasciclin (FAS1) repeats|uniref:Putative surface protein with fasciclin (FAS1) repeats n=1 Tax=Terracoccus luteus TaxID=53356 RepID=A0A495Y3M3_9MICO|nr:fasciclin domain-containing protein [Terracoccus luteus]MBB2987342.1 putative surface protein with fasciclin (FAS1) repeats [Terracoccus luteus]MCP2172993.1 putative surface protein with fasciclin (FAS1) repeats [Terracoccus luteus]RKT79743.1 putative surface protein with fasciclin (FAS1) repeats [Terracoccus luteus]